MDILAKALTVTLLCALATAIIWQLPLPRIFRRIASVFLTALALGSVASMALAG